MNMRVQFPRREQVARSLAAAGIVLAATLLMALIGRSTLGEGVIAMAYLAPIGWCTVRWGRLCGASAALTAALCFDFFFILPLYTFTIGSLEGWLLLFLFMGVSVLVVGRIHILFEEGTRREREAVFMYELLAALSGLHTRAELVRGLASQLQQKYQAALVKVALFEKDGLPALVACIPEVKDCGKKGLPGRIFPVIVGPDLVGEISVWKSAIPLPPDDSLMLQSFLRQLGMALKRAELEERKAAQAWTTSGQGLDI